MNSETGIGGFHNRLAELVGEENPFTWAGRIGIPSGTFDRIWNGKSVPKAAHLCRIAEATGTTVDWLLRGKQPEFSSPSRISETPDGFVLLPRYEVRASAGSGEVVHSEQIVDFLAFKETWVRNTLRRNPANLLLIEAVGDSMEPTISDADLLLVDATETRVRDNAVYAISIAGDLVVKRVQRRVTGELLIISDNPRYSADVVPPNMAADLRVVGQVVWHGGLLR